MEWGPLMRYISHRDIFDAIYLKVGDMIGNGKWKWPPEWYEKFPLVTSIKEPKINIKARKMILRPKNVTNYVPK